MLNRTVHAIWNLYGNLQKSCRKGRRSSHVMREFLCNPMSIYRLTHYISVYISQLQTLREPYLEVPTDLISDALGTWNRLVIHTSLLLFRYVFRKNGYVYISISFSCHPSPHHKAPHRQCKAYVVLHFVTRLPLWPGDCRLAIGMEPMAVTECNV